jgi:hypothetical protein
LKSASRLSALAGCGIISPDSDGGVDSLQQVGGKSPEVAGRSSITETI